MAVAPKLCPGGTVVCIGCGPSLMLADVEYCRGKATVIAVNDAYRLAPWADALMASDAEWWALNKGVPTFAGLKFGFGKDAAKWGVQIMRNTGDLGLEMDPTGLKTGRNSGAAAVNLAVHFGASRILLLGYDMQAKDEKHSHWFGAHKRPLRGNSPYYAFRQMFREMAKPLKKLGVTVINCSRETALEAFPRMALREALK